MKKKRGESNKIFYKIEVPDAFPAVITWQYITQFFSTPTVPNRNVMVFSHCLKSVGWTVLMLQNADAKKHHYVQFYLKLFHYKKRCHLKF